MHHTLGISYSLFLHHVHCDCDMPCLPFLRGFDLRNVLLGFLRVRLLEHLFMRDQSAVRYCQGVVVSESKQGQERTSSSFSTYLAYASSVDVPSTLFQASLRGGKRAQ